MYFNKLCIVILATCFLCACGNSNKNTDVKPASKGLPSEVLLIVDSELWNSEGRKSIENVLKGSVPGLPQYEPMFRVSQIFPKGYSIQFSTFRNIIEIRRNNIKENTEIRVAYDVNATPQTYVRITAGNEALLSELMNQYGEKLTKLFLESEMRRERTLLYKQASIQVDKASREVFGYGVRVPKDVVKIKRGKDFIWASTDRGEKDLNYVCYSVDIKEWDELTAERWTVLRDSALREGIPGATRNMWMTTARTFKDGKNKPLVEISELILTDGRKVKMMRGLWEMHGGGMGGPFVSMAFTNLITGKCIINEGFVYSPSTGKRDLIRQMEAAISTLGM